MLPTFQKCMKPLLEFISTRSEAKLQEAVIFLSDEIFHLSNEEKNEHISSGSQRRIYSNVSWAGTYMKMALLIESPKKGCYKITERGKNFLSKCGESFGMKDLYQFPEFVEFKNRRHEKNSSSEENEEKSEMTPDDALDFGERAFRENLVSDLLEKVKVASPAFFEKIVVKLLVAMGYGGSFADASEILGKSGDEGVDGAIKEDKLGLDEIYIQAKRWKNTTVGRPEIQKFVGALLGKNANKGVFVTTDNFSEEAKDYALGVKNQKKIILIDGKKLAELMIEYNVGISIARTIEIKKIDSDFFEE